MNDPKIYHLALTVLNDISENDPKDKEALKRVVAHLESKRFWSMHDEKKIPSQTISVSIPEFICPSLVKYAAGKVCAWFRRFLNIQNR